jgi:cytochrome c biogenesis protein CcdA
MAFQSPKLQQRIKLGFIILLMVSLVGRLLLTWLPSMIFSLDFRAPSEGELKTLEWPLLMILSLVILFVYLLPVIMGTRGIWGLSRRSIGWAIGFTLLFLGIHAILTFPLIKSQLGDWGANLKTLETQVSDPTIGIFGFDLVTPEQLSLILIAVLIMVFQESGFGVIRYLEYAYRLPESCKRDPEYVKQMDNVLNGHLRHTAGFLTITGLVTMIALGFHSVLLEIVSSSTGSQWAAQVSESIELSLTYGLVISALLFLSLIAVMRFFIPWERVWGLIESLGNKTEAPVEEKKF